MGLVEEDPGLLGLNMGGYHGWGEGTKGTLLTETCPFLPSETQASLGGCQHQVDAVTALPGLCESRREPVGGGVWVGGQCWGS
jgi:hypothetical protein